MFTGSTVIPMGFLEARDEVWIQARPIQVSPSDSSIGVPGKVNFPVSPIYSYARYET
jgi:hypothetical protein